MAFLLPSKIIKKKYFRSLKQMLNKYKDGAFFVRVVYVVVRAQKEQRGTDGKARAFLLKESRTDFTTAAPHPPTAVFYRFIGYRLADCHRQAH